jgi:hypothetical protein
MLVVRASNQQADSSISLALAELDGNELECFPPGLDVLAVLDVVLEQPKCLLVGGSVGSVADRATRVSSRSTSGPISTRRRDRATQTVEEEGERRRTRAIGHRRR